MSLIEVRHLRKEYPDATPLMDVVQALGKITATLDATNRQREFEEVRQ